MQLDRNSRGNLTEPYCSVIVDVNRIGLEAAMETEERRRDKATARVISEALRIQGEFGY